jgi:hypothetical protein
MANIRSRKREYLSALARSPSRKDVDICRGGFS